MCKNRSSAKNLKSRFSVLFTFSTKIYPKSASFFVSLFMALLEIRKNSVQINDFFSRFSVRNLHISAAKLHPRSAIFLRGGYYIFSFASYTILFCVHYINIPPNKYQNINNVYKGLILFFASKHLL